MTVGAVHGPQVAAPRWALGPGRAWGANNEAAHIRTCGEKAALAGAQVWLEGEKWELRVLSQGVNTPKQDRNFKAVVHKQACWRGRNWASVASGTRVFGLPGCFKHLLRPFQGEARSGKGVWEGQQR